MDVDEQVESKEESAASAEAVDEGRRYAFDQICAIVLTRAQKWTLMLNPRSARPTRSPRQARTPAEYPSIVS
jgi:hypothetical protein